MIRADPSMGVMKLKKSLSNPTSSRVLEVIGQSIEPISARNIEIAMCGKENRNSDVYRIVRELAGLNSNRWILLESWSEICSKYNEENFKHDFLRTLNKFFSPYLTETYKENSDSKGEDETDDRMISSDKSSFEFKIRNDRVHNWYYLDIVSSTPVPNVSAVKISDKDKASIRNNIQLSFNYHTKSYQGKGRLKTWLAVLGIPLRVIRNEDKNDFNIYVNESDTIRGRKKNKTPFLKFTPKSGLAKIFDISKSNFRSSEIRISRNISAEGKEEWNKRLETNFQGNYRYYLSLRGFLLYLLGIESILNKDKPAGQKIYKNKYTKQDQHYQTNTKINRLIKALTLNIYTKSDYPFLVNYYIFDAVFGKNYKVTVLKEIAFELQHQLNTLDDDFLTYWITRRFHDEMIYSYAKPSFPYPIYHPIQISLWKNNVKNKYEKDISLKEIISDLKRYDKKMLEHLAHYHEKYLENYKNLTRKI